MDLGLRNRSVVVTRGGTKLGRANAAAIFASPSAADPVTRQVLPVSGGCSTVA